MSSVPVPRPGGRTARVRDAVLDAADDLVRDGHDVVTVRMVSDLSGVSEPTIYRRWRSVQNVLVDAAVRELTRRSPVRVSGDLRTDLHVWACATEQAIAGPAGTRFLSVLIGARTAPDGAPAPPLTAYMDQRIEQLGALLAADAAPAGLSVDVLLDDVLAPLYTRQLLGYAAVRGPEALVDAVLRWHGAVTS